METYQKKAARLRLLAHPIRLHILDVLRNGDECVCHLSAVLNKPQPYVSQQLAILRKGGIVVDYREGTNVFYHLADVDAARQVAAACGPANAADGASGSGRRVIPGCTCPKCADLLPERG